MMKLNFTPTLKMKHSFFTTLFFIFISTFSYAQCGFLDTCPNTDYFNFGMKSTTDATTLEYDNFTSSFHSTLVRTSTGVYKVWGEDMANDGAADLLSPIEMTPANFPGLTGTILKAGLGSSSANNVQGIVLATDGLYAWSTEGQVLHADATSGTNFQKLTINGNSQGLPTGVTPTDVKMMFVTNQTIAITTCSGDVWVISQIAQNTGTGITTLSAANAVKWYRVTQSTSGNPALTNVIAVRGQLNTLFALKSDGTLWTWGTETYLGDNTNIAARTRATQMALPSIDPIKMIGATRYGGGRNNDPIETSFYVLNANGKLYSLGGNGQKQLGDWSTNERKNWVQPRYTSSTGPIMDNIHWLSPNEHDDQYPAVGVLTSTSKLFNWGSANSEMLGRGTSASYDPGNPSGILATDEILAVETGGHTTMVSKKCEDKFGYVGHKIRGSMGDGIDYGSGATESSFTFLTAVVYVCGASTLDVQLTGSIITGTNGKYCNSTTATLIPSPSGGTLALVSGPATLSGDKLTFTGTGNKTVVVSYTYTDPTCGVSKSITLSLPTEDCVLPTVSKTGTLTAFTACSGSVSAEQSFTVSGTDLTADLVVTAPTGYEVSLTSGTGFASSVSITPTTGTVATKTIYVRLAATAINGASGNITLTSTNATTVNVATGTAVVSQIPTAPTASALQVVCPASTVASLQATVGTGETVEWFAAATGGSALASSTTLVEGSTYYAQAVNANSCSSTRTAVTVSTNNALSFDGVNDRVNFASTSIQDGATSFTIEAWIKPNNSNWDGQYHAIFGNQTDINQISSRNPSFYLKDGRIHIDSFEDGTLTRYEFLTTEALILQNVWSHIALVKDGTTFKVYINGNLAISTPAPNAVNISGPYQLGYIDNYYAGLLDEVHFWNTARTASEIATGMNTTLVGNESGLVDYYNFNQGISNGSNPSSTSLLDGTSSANNGAITDFALTGTSSNFVPGYFAQITGSNSVAVGATTQLSHNLSGGTWSSATTEVATVTPSGLVNGLFAGTSVITYTYCGQSTIFTITVVPPIPSLTTSSSTLTAFTACKDSVSAEQSFTVSGSDLTADLVVTAPTGYEVSLTTGTGFATSVSITPTTGTVATTTIYVRLAATAINGTSGNITLTSTNATTINVATGTAVVSPIAVIAAKTATICSASPFSVTPVNGTDVVPADTLYTWTVVDNPNVTGAVNNSGSVTTFIGESNSIKQNVDALVNGIDVGQSFTANQSGALTGITVNFPNIFTSGTATLKVYSGAGNTGSVLSSQTISVDTTGDNTYTLATPVNTTSSQVYTFILYPDNGLDAYISIDNTNSYLGGTEYEYINGGNNVLGDDLYFKTNYTSLNLQASISGTLTNTSTTNQNVVYTVTPKSGTCLGTPFNVTVTVNPLPAAVVYGLSSICSGNSIVLSAANSALNINYTTLSTGAITEATSGWQSFTSGVTGNLSKVSFGYKNTSNTASFIAKLNIYSSEGNTPANLLTSQYVTVNQPKTGVLTLQEFILNSPVALSASSVYTAELVAASTANKISFLNSDSGANAIGGTSNVNSTTDYYFTNEVIPTPSGLSFQWKVDTGSGYVNVATNGTNQFIAPAIAGDYKVTITDNTTTCTNTSVAKTVTLDPKPIANAGIDEKICGTTTATYTISGSSASNYSSIFWFSNGTGIFDDATALHPIYTPSAADKLAGSVNLTMIVGGSLACASEVGYDQMTLSFGLAPTASAGIDASICSNTTFTTVAYATNGTVLWSSSRNGTFDDATLMNPIFTPGSLDITAGNATLTMTVTGTEASCTTTTAVGTVVLTVSPTPTASAGPSDANVCTGLTYKATDAVATNGTIAWTTSGTGTFDSTTIEQPTYTPSSTDLNDGSVVLTMSVSGTTCNAESTIKLLFTPVPLANAGIDAELCSDGIFSTSGIASGGTINWTTSGTGTFSANTSLNTDYTPSLTDTNVTLTLTVTGTNECALLTPVVDTMLLSVSPAPTASAGPVSAGPKTATICSNTTFQTQGQATNGTLLWSTSGTGTFSDATVAAPIYTPSAADKLIGNVTLTITVTGLTGTSCDGKVVFDTIDLNIAPLPTANAGPATDHICAGSTFTLGGTATNGVISWATNGTGTFANATTATPVYTPSDADITLGTVQLTMSVTGNAACTVPTDFIDLRIFKIVLDSTQLNVTCNGLSNGTASVTPSGGTAPYIYVWRKSGNPTIISNLYSATNLTAGNYTCTVTDANLCSATSNFTITQPTVLTAGITSTDITTYGGSNGSATVVGSGGTVTTDYSYSWSPAGGTAATAIDLLAGTYTCTITDDNGCFVTKTATIAEPTNFTATATQTNILCNGATTGSATVVVTGGVSPITYSWSPSGGSGATASALAAGTYTCTIRDNNGAGLTLTKTFTITQPSALTATTSQTNVLIYGNTTGVVGVNVSGGNSPYTYSWTNSTSTSASISGLTAGIYTCTIKDSNGCTIQKTITITQPAILAATNSSSTNVTCNGGATGTAIMAITGGVTPYTYVWTPSVSTGSSANNLVAGTYSCTVTDANGAIQTKSFVITQPTALTATSAQTNISCNSGSNGSATVVVSGGTPGYTYLWSPSGGTGATASGLFAGVYTCTITDPNGCILLKSFNITQPADLSVTPSQTNVVVYGASTGSASVNISGGTSPYTYSWSPSGGTAATANNLAAGSYTCTITDAKGCVKTETFGIVQPSSLTVNTLQTNVLCNGAATGTASVSVSGGTGSYQYLWSPTGGTAAAANGLVAGSYTCTITDTNGALLVQSFTITQPTALTATATQTNVAINGRNTGSATVTVSGGTSGYTYSWTNSLSTSDTASNLVAGTYTCTIIDANACSTTKTFVITEPTALAASATSQINVFCNAGTTGAASVTISGGVLPYTYAWSPSVGSGASVTGLVAGVYSCTITDANGATHTESFTITQPTSLTATTSQTNVNCSAGSNGTATVTATGGTSGYTYSWTNSSSTLATATGLVAGTYACTVTDANGCSISKSFTITQPVALTATTAQTDVAINGNSTGSATVNVTGGTTGYSYSWSNGDTTATTSNLAAGTYTCTITDANSCSVTKTFIITQPTALFASASQTNVLCNGNSTGVATVTASGAVAPYTYSWTNSSSTTATASNLAAGTYVCTITDANNSFITKTVVITEAAVLSATTNQTDVACNAGVTGAASVSVSGGAAPYTYSWYPSGGLGASVSNLAAGTYTCTITDRNGCQLTKSFTISQPAAALTATTAQTNVSCNGGSTGAATVTVSGGTSSYTYSWTNSSSTSATASGLMAGSYVCTITDANGCSITKSFVITQPTVVTATTTQTNVSCNASATGIATVVAAGGAAPYTYLWSNSGGTAATATGLLAGSYTCTITDANGCTLIKSFTITQPNALTVIPSQTDVAISGGTTGSASVNIAGGTPGYTYSWTPSGGTGATANNLAAGSYTCTITDAKGCVLTQSFAINQPSSLTASTSQTNVLCNGVATGTASVTVSGGTSSYNYQWSPAGGTSSSANNLAAGSYTCSITDSNGALLVKSFTITQPSLLTATTSQTNVAINGGATGVASVTVSGGTAGYTYSWLPSGGSGATASNLVAGTYTCLITDANSCSVTKTFVITEPTALVASTSQTNILCNSASTGTASVSVTGGVLPYTYSWSPSVGTGASITGLTAGTYVCTVTDANGATIVKSFTISQPAALTATQSQTNVSCSAGSNGTATVVTSGGTSVYTYSWTNSSSTAATASGLVAGTYACTITDANGCSIVKTFTITQPAALTATTAQTNVAINGNSTGSATVTVSGGTTAYTYSWTNSLSTSATASNLVVGTYTCTITDANGCSVSKTFIIKQPTALIASTSQTNVLCNGASTGVASVTASGAVAPYTYSWTNSSSTTATASNLVAGTYVCTITDANNAVITKSIVITQGAVIPNPIANAGPTTDTICSGLTYATSGTASNGTVVWTTSGSGIFNNASLANAVYTPSAADRATGSVVLTMTVLANGSCNIPSASDSVTLTIYPISNAGIIAGATTVCKGTNSTVLTLSEYTGIIEWQVSTDNVTFNTIPSANAATYTASNLLATTYYRSVVTSGVCSSATSASATIAVSPTSVAGTISGAAPVCYGTNSTGLTVSGNVGNIKWQSSTDNSTFVTIPGATNSTYTASNLTATTYFRAVSTSGVCSSAIATTTIVVNPLPIANAGPSTASICAGTSYATAGVVTNGTASWTTSGTGTFANANSAVTAYTPSSTDQTNGSVVLTMTVTGSASGCTLNTDSDSIIVSINLPSAPVAAANQNLCYLVNPRVADLDTTSGTNINWYAASLGGIALNANTPLISGNTYFATQNVTGCESITRTPVLVSLTCNINAVADTLNSINGYTGGTTPSVLNNDLLNGVLLDPSKVILSGVSIPTGFVLNPNGSITVPAGTIAGSYSLTYKICEVLNPTNCNQAIATIGVIPPVIKAVSDNFGPLNGFQGVTTTSVLANDLLNGSIVSPTEITLSVVTLPTPLVMNPNGTITVPAATASGIYVVNYKISEKLNPTNFSIITAVVTVGDCLIFPTNDCDGDGVTNAQEILDGTLPSDSCSMNFANQTASTTLAWRNADCDGDGITNSQEILDGTNPTDLCSFVLAHKTLTTSADWNNSDCDGDGVRNGQEIIDGTDPSLSCSLNSVHITAATSTAWKNADCDGDGVTNGQEILDGTNPVDVCTFNPANQTLAPSTAWKNADCDGDGVTNGQEIVDGTNPGDLCSFNAARITLTTSTAWNNSDCDGDGVTNGREITDRTNTNDSCSFITANQTLNPSTAWDDQDCDGDGVANSKEIVDKTNPLDACSLVTAHQTLAPSTLWKNSDCDGDGVTNGQEVIDGTDLNNVCSSNAAHVTLALSSAFLSGDCDGDGLTNGDEIGQYPTKPNDADNNGVPDYLEFNNHKVVEDNLEIYNVVTPNGNGDNDVFVIRNIELYPNNTLTIFNRWGVVVYEVDGYGQDDKFFKGISEGRSTMRKLEALPVETYFYSIRYVNKAGVEKQRSGYLYLNK
jgi:gliding motility-associated-like protein